MEIWYSFPVNNLIAPVIYLQVGIGNDVLINLLGFVEADV